MHCARETEWADTSRTGIVRDNEPGTIDPGLSAREDEACYEALPAGRRQLGNTERARHKGSDAGARYQNTGGPAWNRTGDLSLIRTAL